MHVNIKMIHIYLSICLFSYSRDVEVLRLAAVGSDSDRGRSTGRPVNLDVLVRISMARLDR